ncbi:hypothetical protein [Marinobacter sp. DUT-1]|uniref:hypothetical protein n=1 Tax=Marinobacter sp. DUT-1 TaxID=3412037 RepID=UPI003D17079A
MVKGFFPLILLLSFFILSGCDSGPEKEETAESSQPAEEAETAAPASGADISLALKPAQMDWVGQKIFQNECAGKLQCLVHWNEGEAFPSLGIGHFIWYPEGVNGRFVESFPKLIQYMTQRQASVPDWLVNLEPFDAPWPDRETFLEAEDSTRVAELREFLAGTQGLQAEFIFRRARESLDKVVEAAPEQHRERVTQHLVELSATPGGVYALMDYVNFKGEGLAQSERYDGEGWGLLQVLLEMKPEKEQAALDAFRSAAGEVLTRRAENAENPIERERWLPGWLRRLETYREPSEAPSS